METYHRSHRKDGRIPEAKKYRELAEQETEEEQVAQDIIDSMNEDLEEALGAVSKGLINENYLTEKKLHLWMRHDIDKALLAVCQNERLYRVGEYRTVSDILANTIFNRIDRYGEIFDTVNDSNKEDIFEVERLEVNMYVFSKKELQNYTDRVIKEHKKKSQSKDQP